MESAVLQCSIDSVASLKRFNKGQVIDSSCVSFQSSSNIGSSSSSSSQISSSSSNSSSSSSNNSSRINSSSSSNNNDENRYKVIIKHQVTVSFISKPWQYVYNDNGNKLSPLMHCYVVSVLQPYHCSDGKFFLKVVAQVNSSHFTLGCQKRGTQLIPLSPSTPLSPPVATISSSSSSSLFPLPQNKDFRNNNLLINNTHINTISNNTATTTDTTKKTILFNNNDNTDTSSYNIAHIPLSGPLNAPLSGPLNAPLSGPLNSPLSGPLNVQLGVSSNVSIPTTVEESKALPINCNLKKCHSFSDGIINSVDTIDCEFDENIFDSFIKDIRFELHSYDSCDSEELGIQSYQPIICKEKQLIAMDTFLNVHDDDNNNNDNNNNLYDDYDDDNKNEGKKGCGYDDLKNNDDEILNVISFDDHESMMKIKMEFNNLWRSSNVNVSTDTSSSSYDKNNITPKKKNLFKKRIGNSYLMTMMIHDAVSATATATADDDNDDDDNDDDNDDDDNDDDDDDDDNDDDDDDDNDDDDDDDV